MNKAERLKKFFRISDKNKEKLRAALTYLKPGTDIDAEEEIRVEERPLEAGKGPVQEFPEGSLQEKLVRYRRARRYRFIAVGVITAVIVLGFGIYNRIVTFDSYTIAASYENEVASGTRYAAAGKDILKYNADGVTCVSRNNNMKWNITYSMQSPVVDVCGSTMVIGEQHGTQIYVVGKDGRMGNFETTLPILKVRVSRQGVVAAVLQEDNVTWVNLYQADGTLIASDKTTLMESGYPLDVDLSPDGQRMAVSYLEIKNGVIADTVAFYDFGASGQQLENHMISSETFDGVTIPEIYFVDDSRAVAVSDSGFIVFQGKAEPKRTEEVIFEDEIISSFHDGGRIGFVFENENEDADGKKKGRYVIEVYNLSGRRKLRSYTDFAYSSIKMENGQVLLYNDKACAAITDSGHLRFSSDYEKEVADFYYFSEFRKYLVITPDSFDRIRIGNGERSSK